ncbi:MAG TPA: PQQ-binding-like beta-propeller repeat protein [Thermomicrobiales bacterium]|nr:PQQ-binding-like beta-propeller repeat protein [Thermomicrobiales bacterium]
MLRILGAILILLAVMAPVSGTAQAQNDTGMTGANSYRSPHFDYTVEWKSSWRPVVADAQPALDRLVLGIAFSQTTQVAIFGLPAQGDASDLLNSLLGQRTKSFPGATITRQDATGAVPSATVEYDDQGTSFREYIEVRDVAPGESLVAIDFRTADAQFQDNLSSAQSAISFDGGPLFVGASAPKLPPTPEPSPTPTPSPAAGANVNGTTYTSPTFGFTLTWEEGGTEVMSDQAWEDGHDSLILSLHRATGADSPLIFAVEAYEGHQGEASACLQAKTDEGLEGEKDVKPAVDAAGAPIAGKADDSAFAAYTYSDVDEPARQGIYLECRTLIPGKAVIAFVLLSTDASTLVDDIDTARAIIASLKISSSAPVSPSPSKTTGATGDVLMARGNPARTGEMPGPGPDREPAIAWSFPTQEDIYSSPAVVDGAVYFGGNDGRLYAVDALDGSERWHFQTEGHQISSPALADGMAFIGSDDDHIYAVDTATGKEQWRFDAGSYVYASPVVVDNVVYAGTGAGLYAIDAATGAEIWHLQDEDIVSFQEPAVADGMVYAGGDAVLVAVDAAGGRERWRFETPGDIPAAPAIAGGVIFFGTEDGGFYAIDAETGQERWHVDTDEINVAAAIANGVVYVGDSTSLYALDAGTGKERWQVELEDGLEYSSPTVAGGVVFAADDDGLHAFDAGTGEELWRMATESTLTSDPVAVDGVIYVGDFGGAFHAISAGAGTESTVLKPGRIGKSETATATIVSTSAPERVTPESTAEGAVYESPRYGYRLVYDPDQWHISVEDSDPADPFDTVTLANDASYVYLVGDPNFGPNQLQACVDAYHAALAQLGGVSDVQSRSADSVAQPERMASSVDYLYTPASGQPYRAVDYVECRALDGVTLVIQQEAPATEYEAQAAAREILLKGLEPPR